jgi:hypothetical protein
MGPVFSPGATPTAPLGDSGVDGRRRGRHSVVLQLRSLLLLSCTLGACAGTTDDVAATDDNAEPCAYPQDAKNTMALGEVLKDYSWPVAVHRDGREGSFDLELGQVPCDTDPDIDWSPFDVLLFVSIPAW